MTSAPLSIAQRGILANALSARMSELILRRSARLLGRSRGAGGAGEAKAFRNDMDEREFDAVSQALHCIHGIGYGLCASCGTPIPFERLRAEPQAARCIACESMHEDSSNSPGHTNDRRY